MPTSLVIAHDPSRCRFEALIEGQVAYLAYRRPDARSVDFRHTFVPPAFRRRSIGRELVRHGVAWAAEHGLEVTASCGFVERIMNEDVRA